VEISELESRFGQEIPTDLKSFYALCNGLQLTWRVASSQTLYEAEITKAGCPFPLMWPAEQYWQLTGVINIPDLQTLLFRDYKDFMWIDHEKNYEDSFGGNKINSQTFKKKFLPFDIFDKYYTAALYLSEDKSQILLGDDHNASFLNFEPMDFEIYLVHTLNTFGEISARINYFHEAN